ncbi:hypothetical protein BJ170DRAFT_364660 [Xylariales sp. AK1849]|nr:hypothetical protein BJ170DRAFT_364660 [Xylariales sp. AK1849]
MTHANSEDLPLSPWAKRFYPSTDPYWRTLGGQIHSSLAPEFPSLHVDGYRWDPTLGPLPKPDNQSLDRLFYAERSQRGILGGVQSWQVAAIASQPYGYGPKDPLPEHSRDPAWERFWQERVVVNEVSWFPFFHRVRWFDLRANCFESIRDPFPEMRDHSTNWWTVDNWVIWDHLSVSIEIANRILRRLIDERDIWLDALLFRDRISWSLLNSDIQLKASTELGYDPQLLLPLTDPKFTADSATMAARMEQLNDRTVFGFFDEAGSWDEFKAYGLSSVTDMPMQSGEKVPWNTILIHVGFLRTLCDRDTSLSERCNMQAVLAFTILHELMHATYWGKQRERGFQAPITEPYVYPELKCELGASFEYNTFGGVTREVPSVPATYNFTGLNTHVNMYSWPRWFETGDLPEAVTLKTSTLPITFDYTIPLLWTSALQNEAFWKRVVEKHGKVAFRAPRILRSEVWGPWYGIGSRAFGIHRMRVDDNTPEELKAGYISVLNRWQERRINWDYMRQWYPDEYRKWSLSPWSWTYAREVIGNFREAHGRKDIFKCLEFARELMRGETAFLALRDTTSDNPMTWLFVSIGTLMCASIPLLTQDVDFAGPMKLVEIHPNSQGVPPFAVSTTGSIKLTELQMEALRDRSTTSKSHWPHPVHGIYAFWNDFYPSAKKHPMPKVWLEATYDVARSLWNRHVAGTQTNEWLPWDFQIPHYDTQWAIASETGTVENGMNMLTFDPCDPPITEAGRLMSPPPSPTDIGPNMLPTSGSVPTVSMRKKGKNDLKDAPERRYPKYYTVSEVGNHILSNESTWVIEPDGESGFDVYRITSSCPSVEPCRLCTY